jgi:hypothetical protein
MRNLRSLALGAAFASVALLGASPASAAGYLFDETNDSYTLNFDGFVGDPTNVIPGLTSQLMLTLTGGVGTNTLSFSYLLTNTSSVGGPNSRVSGFAFDSNPNVDPATGLGTPTGDFGNINLGGNYPNAIGGVEVCLTGSAGASCAGGASGGATLGDPASGTFSLIFGSNTSAVTLDDFYVRYQSLTGLGDITSATGKESLEITTHTGGVPEPATWATLLIGFGGVGATLRTRKSNTGRRLRVA